MKIRKYLSSARIIIFGFAGVILTGTFFLMLPIASRSHSTTPLIDALFTSTSAVCVTGLVVRDTATYWTQFGQFVIMLLMQIGGMGVVTVALTVAMFSGRNIGLMQRTTMQDSIGAPQMGGIVRMVRFILKGVILLEGLGALSMSFVFVPEFGWRKGIWYSVFHSVSAFCNAGFDLMGIQKPFSSMVKYADNPVINITIMLLIVIGGLGFFVWEEILKHRWHFKKYTLQAKVVLMMTTLLIFLPALYFYLGEFAYVQDTSQRIYVSLFQSVTLRTAGFNTIDFNRISQAGVMLMSILMIIGGSPGSTAGGMKTTTFAVVMSDMFGVFHKDKAHIFGRRIPTDTMRSATSLFVMYVSLFVLAAMLISRIEELPLLTCLFETSSGIGTVGCSMGITSALHGVSKAILIVLMYFGRVGGLTLIYAVTKVNRFVNRLPEENITVG